MNPQEAHQIANLEILEVLKTWKEYRDERKEEKKGNWVTYTYAETRAKLEGILIAQEKEIEFLKDYTKTLKGNKVPAKISVRHTALKISCEDLRRVLK